MAECCCPCCSFSGAIVHQVDTHVFNKEQIEVISKLLLHIFCGKDMKVCLIIISFYQVVHIP